jgi:hypothetical protein
MLSGGFGGGKSVAVVRLIFEQNSRLERRFRCYNAGQRFGGIPPRQTKVLSLDAKFTRF